MDLKGRTTLKKCTEILQMPTILTEQNGFWKLSAGMLAQEWQPL
jgi:hypothetical protein